MGCKGVPKADDCTKQGEVQKKWRDEVALVPGAAPFVPRGRRPKASGAVAGTDLAKKLKTSEAARKKAEAETKRLRDAKLPKTAAQPPNEQVKAFQKKLKGLREALTVDPTDVDLQAAVKKVEQAIDAEKPTQVVHISELHAELEELEGKVREGMEKVKTNSSQIESIKKQISNVIAANDLENEKIVALKARIAERTVVAPIIIERDLQTATIAQCFENA